MRDKMNRGRQPAAAWCRRRTGGGAPQESGERKDARDHSHRGRAKAMGQRGVGIIAKDPDRVKRGEDDDAGDVGQARDEEERDRPAADVLAAQAAATEGPRPKRQPTGAAD
jgi:hypothetical protein